MKILNFKQKEKVDILHLVLKDKSLTTQIKQLKHKREELRVLLSSHLNTSHQIKDSDGNLSGDCVPIKCQYFDSKQCRKDNPETCAQYIETRDKKGTWRWL